MGKKKSYNKMFDETVAEPIAEQDLNPIEPVAESVTEPVVETVVEPVIEETIEFATGIVTDCNSLNVRAMPDRKAPVSTILMAGAEVQVNVTDSYDEWYHVFTATGLDGFCMKNYIAIKE